MSRKWFLCLGAVVLFLVLGSCKTEDNGPPPDPVDVDKEMPKIPDLPSVEGAFPENEEIAFGMVEAAMSKILGQINFSGTMGLFSNAAESGARAAVEKAQAISEKWENDPTLISGARVTGFVEGEIRGSLPDSLENINLGDYVQIDLRSVLVADLDPAVDEGMKMGGKSSLDAKINGRAEITMEGVSVKGTVDAAAAYALSISANGYGIKVLVEMTVKGIDPLVIAPDDIEQLETKLPGLFREFGCRIVIYNGENEEKYTRDYALDDILNGVMGDMGSPF